MFTLTLERFFAEKYLNTVFAIVPGTDNSNYLSELAQRYRDLGLDCTKDTRLNTTLNSNWLPVEFCNWFNSVLRSCKIVNSFKGKEVCLKVNSARRQ